jgi:Ca-activated chloride channel family protein
VRFERPEYLIILFLLPILALLYFYSFHKTRKKLDNFCKPELLPDLIPSLNTRKTVIRHLLLLGSLGFLIVSLAGLGWKYHDKDAVSKGREAMIVLDVSPSMMAQDVVPSRFGRAKQEVINFIQKFQGNRLGAVIFSGRSRVLCPLTADRECLIGLIEEIGPDAIPVYGTALGPAIEKACAAFPSSNGDVKRALVVFSDGEDHEGGIERGIQIARRKKISIWVVGVGSTQGAPIPEMPAGQKYKYNAGRLVLSALNEVLLRDIALKTGGGYFKWDEIEIKRLWRKPVEEFAAFDGSRKGAGMEKMAPFQWLLLGGIMCLVWAIVRSE